MHNWDFAQQAEDPDSKARRHNALLKAEPCVGEDALWTRSERRLD